MSVSHGSVKREGDERRGIGRVEDSALIAVCCLAVLTLLTLVGAGFLSMLTSI